MSDICTEPQRRSIVADLLYSVSCHVNCYGSDCTDKVRKVRYSAEPARMNKNPWVQGVGQQALACTKCRIPHLWSRVQLQQSAAKGSTGIVVLQFTEDAHRTSQRKCRVVRLQLGMCEVGCKLSSTLWIFIHDFSTLHLRPQSNVVFSACKHSIAVNSNVRHSLMLGNKCASATVVHAHCLSTFASMLSC